MIRKIKLAAIVAALTLTSVAPAPLRAEEFIEKAGVATGVTVGNTIAVPLKAVSMTFGALSGVLSYILTGGNSELTQQIWQDTLQGPYVITPELARMSVGQRPELDPKK